jgi:hypothetical protein
MSRLAPLLLAASLSVLSVPQNALADPTCADVLARLADQLDEVQNGNHIETFKDAFPQLEVIQPHAQAAFDLLVEHVERHAALPPSQCIPRGGAISPAPAHAGHCARLLEP